MSRAAQRQAAGHDVIFAGTDGELVAVAAERLGRALAAGSTAIVIATPEHRHGFAEALVAAEVDVADVRAEGRLIELDAARTLDRLMVGAAFDPEAFDRVIGTLVRKASERRPVYAFGEMVGLLWDEGRVQEAVDLEMAWNRLLDETSAELLCGYASAVVDDHARAAELQTVCRLHSAVVSGEAFERTWHFDAELTRARAARRVVTSALRARGIAGATLYDAQILLGELVSNAVRHARTPFSVSVLVDDDRIVVAVGDDSEELPVAAGPPTPGDSSGRGLHLVTALARRWAAERREDGKVVWAEMAR